MKKWYFPSLFRFKFYKIRRLSLEWRKCLAF